LPAGPQGTVFPRRGPNGRLSYPARTATPGAAPIGAGWTDGADVFEQVRQAVSSWQSRHPGSALRIDGALCFDVSNRLIDGSCYLFFGGPEQGPLLVAKAARTPAGRAVFETEYRNLQALDERGLNAATPCTPAPQGRLDDGGVLVALQSALGGTPLKNLPGPALFGAERVEATFDRVIELWERLQAAFGTRRVALAGADYEREVLQPVRRLAHGFVLDAAEIELLEERFERRRGLSGLELPWMVRHGDFCTANLLQGPRGLGAIDWEFPLEPATPLFDLFYFFSSTRFPFAGRRGESSHLESFRAVWWDENYVARAARARLRAACARHGVPARALPDLFLLSLVQVANMKLRGLLDSHGLELDLDRPAGEAERAARWAAFSRPDADTPFFSVRGGVFENLRLVARYGLPAS
jgi:hypothetical protein